MTGPEWVISGIVGWVAGLTMIHWELKQRVKRLEDQQKQMRADLFQERLKP